MLGWIQKAALCLLLLRICVCDPDSDYNEELSVTPLPNGHLHTNFNFNITSSKFPKERDSASIISNFNVFPNALINLLSQTHTANFSIRLTSGYWNSENWGKLPENGQTSGGNGLELWATIKASSKQEAFSNWKFLANSLSGFFCASLNFIDETITTFPEYAFKSGDLKEGVYLLKASLPREPVCTENLTPIIKLLPTKGRAGISSLLDGHKVFDSKWVSTSIDVQTFDEGNYESYKLTIHLNNVFNIPLSLDKLKRPLPKPIPGEELNCDYDKFYDSYHCFPSSDYTDKLEFSLEKVFNKKIVLDEIIGASKVCVYVDRSNENLDWKLQSQFSSQDPKTGHFLYASKPLENDCFALSNTPKKREDLDILFTLNGSYNNISLSDDNKPGIYVTRSITGYELDKGGFRIVFKNPSNRDLDVIYFESLPWYLRLYLHKLQIMEKSLLQSGSDRTSSHNKGILKNISYTTAIDRQRPAKIELLMKIPKQSIITITYSFDKSLLLYSEYPPDANHGFELDPAVVTLFDTKDGVISPYYILRTSTLLVSLPTPDFSMPYNVIILTSTIMALIFGTVFNLLVKRIVSEEDYERLLNEIPQKGWVAKVLEIRSKIRNGVREKILGLLKQKKE